MSSDSDIVMDDRIVGKKYNKENLPEGATREINYPKTNWEIASQKTITPTYQLVIGTDKMNHLEKDISDEGLAELFGAKKEEVEFGKMNGAGVAILTYENQEQKDEATARNPLVQTMKHSKVNNGTDNRKNEWVKIRQWPIGT